MSFDLFNIIKNACTMHLFLRMLIEMPNDPTRIYYKVQQNTLSAFSIPYATQYNTDNITVKNAARKENDNLSRS